MAALYSSPALKLLLAGRPLRSVGGEQLRRDALHLRRQRRQERPTRACCSRAAPAQIADRYGRGPMDGRRTTATATLRVSRSTEAHPELKAAPRPSRPRTARAAAPERNDAANLAAKGAIFGSRRRQAQETTTVVKTVTQAPSPAGAAGPQGERERDAVGRRAAAALEADRLPRRRRGDQGLPRRARAH